MRLFIQEDKLLASNFPKHRVLEAINSSGVLNGIRITDMTDNRGCELLRSRLLNGGSQEDEMRNAS